MARAVVDDDRRCYHGHDTGPGAGLRHRAASAVAVGIVVVAALRPAFAVPLIAGHGRLADLRGAIRGRWPPARAVVRLVSLPGVTARRAWQRPRPLAPRPIAVRGPDPVPLVASYPRVAPGTAPTAGG